MQPVAPKRSGGGESLRANLHETGNEQVSRGACEPNVARQNIITERRDLKRRIVANHPRIPCAEQGARLAANLIALHQDLWSIRPELRALTIFHVSSRLFHPLPACSLAMGARAHHLPIDFRVAATGKPHTLCFCSGMRVALLAGLETEDSQGCLVGIARVGIGNLGPRLRQLSLAQLDNPA